MRLTKKKAIEISIELWEFLAETGGKHKADWSGWEMYGQMWANCPLCEYTRLAHPKEDFICPYCPLKSCHSLAYGDWLGATTKKDRKKYASQFLEQLKELK